MKTKKTRNKKITRVLIVAALLTALVAIGVYWLLNPHRSTIYIFNGDYPAGAQVSETMLTAVEIDSNAVVNSTNTVARNYMITGANLHDALNAASTLRTDVYKGDILTASLLSSISGNTVEMRMAPDSVAVSVAVNGVTGVTNQLGYGDNVNIYACYDGSASLILQGQKVLAAAYVDGELQSVTLELSVADSIRLIHANNYATIQLGLVNTSGYQYVDGLPSYNLGGFVNTSESKDSKENPTPAQAEAEHKQQKEGNEDE